LVGTDTRMLLVEIAERFGKNLVRARKRAGMSQEEVGIRATLHRTEIGLLERGERLPRIDTMVKLAGALGVPPVELIAGIDWQPADMTKGSFRVSATDPDLN
jgi:transcriptional regulator with XRE-family HTH domain